MRTLIKKFKQYHYNDETLYYTGLTGVIVVFAICVALLAPPAW